MRRSVEHGNNCVLDSSMNGTRVNSRVAMGMLHASAQIVHTFRTVGPCSQAAETYHLSHDFASGAQKRLD